MNIKFSPPDISESDISAVGEALRSGWITTGPRTKNFEKKLAEYCGADRAVCLNSATACMELCLRIFGIGQEDEVITSAYTYTASASVIEHVGAKVVLVDTASGSYEMDYDKLADAITEKTKAIIPVDIGGMPCDYDTLYKIVESKKALFAPNNDMQKALGRVLILADAAHSFGASYKGKSTGTIGDFASFSFHAVKNLTTGEGGALVWKTISGIDDDAIYKHMMLLSLHGQSKDALAKTQIGAWEYDIVAPYYKCNMTDIMAALGLSQLERYDALLARRKEIVAIYDKMLKGSGIDFMSHEAIDRISSRHLYLTNVKGVDIEGRNEIIKSMAEKGIACNVHYKPLPMHTAYKKMGFVINDFPNAYKQFANEITLPLHTLLTNEEVEYVAYSYVEAVNAAKK